MTNVPWEQLLALIYVRTPLAVTSATVHLVTTLKLMAHAQVNVCEFVKKVLIMYLNTSIDIDECSSSNVCGQVCINTIGSYTCNCYTGYVLNATTRSCHG